LPNHTEIEMRVAVWSDYLGNICLISISGNNDMPSERTSFGCCVQKATPAVSFYVIRANLLLVFALET
jgi:hypothetical protein